MDRTTDTPDVNGLPLPSPPPRVARYALGATFLAYFVGTALLYFFGPWQYPMAAGRGRLIAFVIAAHAAFAVGYLLGVRGTPRAARLRLPVQALVLASVTVQLALLLPTSQFATGQWIPNPWSAASNLGAVYADSLRRRSEEIPYVNYIRILLSPLLVAAIPLAVFYWHRLPRVTKVLVAAFVVGTLMLYVATGTNAAAGEWMGLFPWFVIAGHLSGVQRLDRRGWTKAAAVQALSIVFFAMLFSATMAQRSGSFVTLRFIPGIDAKLEREHDPKPDAERQVGLSDRELRDRVQALNRKLMNRDLTEEEMRQLLSHPKNQLMLRTIAAVPAAEFKARLAEYNPRGTAEPNARRTAEFDARRTAESTAHQTAETNAHAANAVSQPRSGLRGLTAYFSQGYFAVYLSLNEPFVPCYGVGSSLFLQRQVARLTGNSRSLECSYPVRIEKRGWNAAVYWATIYPWIASDVTFPGTVVIVFLIGWLAGRVWLDVLGGQNSIAVVLLAPVLLILYYFPAHNRMLQTGEGVVALCVLVPAWLMARRRAVLRD